MNDPVHFSYRRLRSKIMLNVAEMVSLKIKLFTTVRTPEIGVTTSMVIKGAALWSLCGDPAGELSVIDVLFKVSCLPLLNRVSSSRTEVGETRLSKHLN